MSQVTGLKFATTSASPDTGLSVNWTNIGNVFADDGADAAVTITSTALNSETLKGQTFKLLSEDGGPIVANATIIKVTMEMRVSISVTDNLTANVATVNLRGHSPDGTDQLSTSFTQADNTNSDQIRTWNTGGTQASPQTTFTRAELADGQFTVAIDVHLPTGALNQATCSVDYIGAQVEWIAYVDKDGGARGRGDGGSPAVGRTVLLTRVSAGASAPASAGNPGPPYKGITLSKPATPQSVLHGGAAAGQGGGVKHVVRASADGALCAASGGGVKHPAISRSGGAGATGLAGGARTIFASKAGGALAPAAAGATRATLVARSGGGQAAGQAGGTRTLLLAGAGGGIAFGASGAVKHPAVSKPAGAVATGSGGGQKTLLVSGAGGALVVMVSGGAKHPALGRPGGALVVAAPGAEKHPAVAKAGGALADHLSSGSVRRVLARRDDGGLVGSTAGGDGRLYTYGLSGFSRAATGAVLPTADVRIFRSDTDVKVGQIVSDASGAWSVALTSEPVTYWVRADKLGSPDRFGTTARDIAVEETLVSGPPP